MREKALGEWLRDWKTAAIRTVPEKFATAKQAEIPLPKSTGRMAAGLE